MTEPAVHVCDECRNKDFEEVQHRLIHKAIDLNNKVKKTTDWPTGHNGGMTRIRKL